MFSLLRWNRLDRVPRWGFLVLLVGMTGPWVRAAEPTPDESDARDGSAIAGPAFESREQAIEQLERLGQQVRESASGLIELIASPAAPLELRRRAVLAMAAIGPENQEQAQVLFDLLADPPTDVELRRTILMAFGEKVLFAPLLVPALLKVVEAADDEPLLRRQALFALGRFANAESVAPALGRVIANPAENAEFRLAVLGHLRRSDSLPGAVFEILAELIGNRQQPARLRTAAIETLRGIGPGARSTAPALVEVLSEAGTELPVRLAAALALRQTGWPDEASTALVELLFDSETPAELRVAIAEMTANLDRLPAGLATQWLPALEDAAAPLPVRRLAARMLAKADLSLPDGVELGGRLLRDPGEDFLIRRDAAEFLRRLGVRAEPARATLETILLSSEAPAELRELASTALAQVAQAWLERPDRLDRATLNQRLASLDHAVDVMEQAALNIPPHPQNLETVRRLRDVLRAEKASRWSGRIGDWAEAHPAGARWAAALLVLGAGCGLLTATWWALTWIAPLRLGRLEEWMRRTELALPRWLGGRAVGLRQLSLLSRWGDHERVLEAWTLSLRKQAATALERHQHPTDAGIFVDLPAKVEGQFHETLPSEAILDRLARPGAGVIISGGAATGKTTVALRLAIQACSDPRTRRGPRTRFLPVWIDPRELGSRADLIEAIRGQLDPAPAGAEVPSPALIRVLLERGRIVLILDGVSEWAAADQDRVFQVLAQLGQTPVLMTARQAGYLAERRPIHVELSRLDGPVVAAFVSGCFKQSGREPGSSDADVLEACRYWGDLTGDRAMPVEAVRLFAEFLQVEPPESTGPNRPENLIDLVRASIRHRNHRVQADPWPDEVVLRLAGQLAWACTQHGGRVRPEQLPESLTPQALSHLEQGLALIRTHRQTGEIGFLRQTVADHLAAGHLIDTWGKDDEAWKRMNGLSPDVSAAADEPLTQLGEAIWDACYRLSDPFAPVPIPDWLHAALEQRLTAPGQGPFHLNPRVRQLTRLVLAPENPERTRAIDALAALGPRVEPVMPALLSAFRNANEDLEVRYAVLALLSRLERHAAPATAELRSAILNRKEHLFLRIRAIDVLLRAGPDDPATLQILADRAQDPAEAGVLRTKAAEAAATSNRPAGEIGSQAKVPDASESPQ
ncbi:MAG: hypothetical protein KJ072_15370 [Verrucomicrobia bacterium]|nr:hypothetical protein [Verrucomicrobiota bacterium]